MSPQTTKFDSEKIAQIKRDVDVRSNKQCECTGSRHRYEYGKCDRPGCHYVIVNRRVQKAENVRLICNDCLSTCLGERKHFTKDAI